MRKEALVLREISEETLDGTADHGVLAHQHNGLAAHADSDLVHLLRRDIVDGDNEDGLVLFKESLKFVEVDGLSCGLAPHVCDLFELRDISGKLNCLEWVMEVCESFESFEL